MNRAVFLDRDGTIAKDVHYCRRPEDFVLFTDAAGVIKLLNNRGFKVIIITNQSGIAHGYLSEETLGEIHKKMKEELGREGARIDGIYYCPHHPDANCGCRKPKPSLILQATRDFKYRPETFLRGRGSPEGYRVRQGCGLPDHTGRRPAVNKSQEGGTGRHRFRSCGATRYHIQIAK